MEDGKITRVRPIQIPEEDYPKAWVVEDRNGRKYSPPKAMRIAQNILAERNRLYSEDRIMYPMKRVDWDPNGERNQRNRGKSGFERISWDEAATIIAGEINRLAPSAPTASGTGTPSPPSPVLTTTGALSATRWRPSAVSSAC